MKMYIVSVTIGEGNGNPLHNFCLENPMDRGAWQAIVHTVTKSRTRLSDLLSLFTFMHWRRQWQPPPVFLPGESQGRRSLVGCRLWGRTESDTTEATQQQQQQQLGNYNLNLTKRYQFYAKFILYILPLFCILTVCLTSKPQHHRGQRLLVFFLFLHIF